MKLIVDKAGSLGIEDKRAAVLVIVACVTVCHENRCMQAQTNLAGQLKCNVVRLHYKTRIEVCQKERIPLSPDGTETSVHDCKSIEAVHDSWDATIHHQRIKVTFPRRGMHGEERKH